MAFDPSVLAQIPGYGPDPMKAVSQGVTLADQYNKQQTGAIDLQNARQQQADTAQAREALKGVNLQDPGQANAALMKIQDPNIRMKVMAQLNTMGNQKREATLQDMEIADKKLDTLGRTLDPVLAQLDQIKSAPGMTQAMLDAKAKHLVIPAVLQLRNEHPELAPEVDRFLQDPNHMTYQGVRSVDAQTKWGSQAIKARLNEAKQAETERKNAKQEGFEERKVSLAERKEAQREREDKEGVMSDDSVNMAAERILNGEQARDVLANFGRGKQGGNNITKVQNRVAELARERNVSPQDLSARMVEFKGLQKEQQTEASIAGRISYAEKEIQQIGPKVLEYSNKVDRGSFVPWNRLKQMGEASISDPNLKKLKAYLTTLTNSYDVLGGRGGTDVEKRAHNRELLDAADSPEALKAAVDAIIEEAGLSHEAARESMTVDRSRLSGGQGTAGGGGAGAGNPPSGAGAAAPGWGKATVVPGG